MGNVCPLLGGKLSHLVAVFLEIPSLRLAWRTDRPTRKTRQRNLLKVPTLITRGQPCSKIEQDRPMKWLKFGCKFPSKWLSFRSQSTKKLNNETLSSYFLLVKSLEDGQGRQPAQVAHAFVSSRAPYEWRFADEVRISPVVEDFNAKIGRTCRRHLLKTGE